MSEQPEVNEEIKEPKQLNLYQKINAVMKEIDYLQKDDNIKFASTNYKAISEEKVTSTVRASLVKNGLVILPVEQDHHREGTLSTVDTKYKIVDADTGQFEIIVSSGTGVDTQDKGVGKAMTYSYKYLLLRTFAIPTGEDPDKISNAEIEDKQKKQQNKGSQQNQPPKTNNNNNNNNTPKPISPGQKSAMGAKLDVLVKLYGGEKKKEEFIASLEAKKEVGKFGSISNLSLGQASKAIGILDGWIKTKEKQQGAQ